MDSIFLDIIPEVSAELPSIITGEETSVDLLVRASAVCGWIREFDADTQARTITHPGADTVAITYTHPHVPYLVIGDDVPAEQLAELGRMCINAAISKKEQD